MDPSLCTHFTSFLLSLIYDTLVSTSIMQGHYFRPTVQVSAFYICHQRTHEVIRYDACSRCVLWTDCYYCHISHFWWIHVLQYTPKFDQNAQKWAGRAVTFIWLLPWGRWKWRTWKWRTIEMSRHENDGPSKCPGMKLTDMKLTDMKVQDTFQVSE